MIVIDALLSCLCQKSIPASVCSMSQIFLTVFKDFSLALISSCSCIFSPSWLGYSQQNTCFTSSHLKANKHKIYSLDPTFPSNYHPTVVPLQTCPNSCLYSHLHSSLPILSSACFNWAFTPHIPLNLFFSSSLMTSTYQPSPSWTLGAFYNMYMSWSCHLPLTFLMTRFNIHS